MAQTRKVLQTCPTCRYAFQPKDYLANLAICKACHSSFPKHIIKHNFIYTHRKWLVGITLSLATAQFIFLTYSHRDTLLKKDSTPTHYIKRYWSDIKEQKLLVILKGCIKKNDLKCQMLAYKKLNEINPNDSFYKKSYESRRSRWQKNKNRPSLKW